MTDLKFETLQQIAKEKEEQVQESLGQSKFSMDKSQSSNPELHESSHLGWKKIDYLCMVFEHLSQAVFGAFLSRSWYQLQDICRFFLNICIREQLNPWLHKGTDAWKHLAFLSECLNQSLQVLYQMLHSEKKSFFQTVHENTFHLDGELIPHTKMKFKNDDLETTQEYYFASDELKGQFDNTVFADIICYTTQVLFIEERYELLVSITQEFDNVTQHKFSQYLLPFTLHGLQNLRNTILRKKKRIKQQMMEMEKHKP